MTQSITERTTANILPEFADGFLRRLRATLFLRLNGLRGQLIAHDEDGVHTLGIDDGSEPVRIEVHNLAFYAYTALGGEIGVGQSWILKLWDVNDLVALARLFMRNRDHLNGLSGLAGRLRMPLYRFMERRRKNNLLGSRRNIAAHYDLGNELFALFLDPGMTYSSAVWPQPDASLEEAQTHKYDLICQKLQLQAGERLIEIGTGWGGLALHAAQHYDVHVTTTTISANQHEWAARRIREESLEDKITLLERDYRELDPQTLGTFDKLVSIEMIEAVGYQYMPGYLEKCASLLKADGQMLIQAITIQDQLFDSMRRTNDYIREFIFPGGMLPSVADLLRLTSKNTDLRLFALDDYAPDYARTLAQWRTRFHANREQVLALGYDEAFIRMWDYYLASCEGGFAEQVIGVAHLLFVKGACVRGPVARTI